MCDDTDVPTPRREVQGLNLTRRERLFMQRATNSMAVAKILTSANPSRLSPARHTVGTAKAGWAARRAT
eukprot:12983347-Heterocapsa_arctica.AAC.1